MSTLTARRKAEVAAERAAFLHSAARLLGPAAPAISAHLLSHGTSFSRTETPSRLSSKLCAACGHRFGPKDARLVKSAPSQPTTKTINCSRCKSSTTITARPAPPSKPSRLQSVANSGFNPKAPAGPTQPTKPNNSLHAQKQPSKPPSKKIKMGGLESMLAKKKKQAAQPSFSLKDFMSK